MDTIEKIREQYGDKYKNNFLNIISSGAFIIDVYLTIVKDYSDEELGSYMNKYFNFIKKEFLIYDIYSDCIYKISDLNAEYDDRGCHIKLSADEFTELSFSKFCLLEYSFMKDVISPSSLGYLLDIIGFSKIYGEELKICAKLILYQTIMGLMILKFLINLLNPPTDDIESNNLKSLCYNTWWRILFTNIDLCDIPYPSKKKLDYDLFGLIKPSIFINSNGVQIIDGKLSDSSIV